MSDTNVPVLAPIDTNSPAAEKLPENPCVKCGAEQPKKAAWCAACGWYPAYNMHVDPAGEENEETAKRPQGLPRWAILLGGTVTIVFSLAVAGRLATPVDSTPRLIWALVMLGAGMIAFLAAHTINYMCAIMLAADLTLLDFFLKPFALWKTAFGELPQSITRICVGLGGVLSCVLALVVVDGIPWAKLFADKAPPPRPQESLVSAITKHAQNGQAADDKIEDAVKRFADGKGDKDKEKKEARPETIDCVVVGYEPIGRDRIGMLMLATVVDNKLSYVGQVGDGVPPQQQEFLRARFKDIETPKSFLGLENYETVRWLRPMVTCRVKFRKWSEDRKRIIDPAWEKQLADIKPQ